MGRLTAALGARGSTLANPDPFLQKWFGAGSESWAGINVSEDTALHYGPFFAGVRLISEDVGSLPFPVYRRLDPRGRERAREHPLYHLLNGEANEMMSAQAFRETIQGHALMWGNGYAEIVRNGRGDVDALWPLRPDRMTVKRRGAGKRKLVYRYLDHNAGIVRDFDPREILHVYGLGFNGVRGYSILELARHSIGLGVAAERFGGEFFSKNARPAGVLTHPGMVSDVAKKNMRDSWEKLHRNSQRIAILEEGVTWQALGIPPGDAQFLETRRFEVVDMARWLRLPPHKLGELGRATWANIESEQIDYVSSALRVWLTRWENAVNNRALTSFDREQGYSAEHIMDALLRGDTASRMQAYRIGREMGIYSADDVLELENRNPLPDGKGSVYFVPLNWTPAPGPDEDPFRAVPSPRRTATRSVTTRRRIARAFRPLLADADLAMAKRERDQVAKLVNAHLQRRQSPAAFAAAVDDLYEDDILPATIARWTAPLLALANEIAAEAANEIAVDEPADLDSWVAEYVAAHSAYRIGSAKRAILSLVDTADTAELVDLADAIIAHLDRVVDERPDRAALWESNQMANSAAREQWREAGISRLIWVASGGDTCPWCTDLDGKVVDIDDTFAAKGDTFDGDDDHGPLGIGHDTFAPPLHPGCDCSIVAA